MRGNGDGSYTAKLNDGPSIIRITAADGTVAYRVIKAYGIDVTIDSDNVAVELEDGQYSITTDVNDTVEISFDGIWLPFPKLGAVYNPGFPDKSYVHYILNGQDTTVDIESEHCQYSIDTINTITLDFDSPDTYVLSDGSIHTTALGSPDGGHRAITRGGMTGMQSTYVPGQDAGETVNGYFCVMPDITLTVSIPDETVPVLTETSAGSQSATGATVSFKSDEAGDYYYVVLAATEDAPTADTIKDGASGTAIAGVNSFDVHGLTASTDYKAYVVVEDASGQHIRNRGSLILDNGSHVCGG